MLTRALPCALALLALVALQCAPASPQAPASVPVQGVQFDRGVGAEIESKRVATGHVLVRPILNGRRAGWFLFDTGAGICCIATSRVDEFDLTPDGELASVGIGGGQSSRLFRARELRLGRLTSNDHPLMAVDLEFLREHLGEEICGVIGYGVLSRCVAEFDPLAPRVALHDPAAFDLPASAWTQLEFVGRVPALRARFEDREGLFRLDTGANAAVTFGEPAVSKWKLLEGRATRDAKLGGVGGFVAAREGELAWFELAGQRRAQVPALFALERKGTHASTSIDGSIGAELLKPFELVLDYPHERIAFRARTAPATK